MADISRLSRLLNGIQRGVSLSTNTLVVDNLKIKMGSGDDANHATFSGTLTSARTISMPDANVDLADIALNTAARHDAVTLNADDPTQQTLNLAGQELQVNLATASTDGAMSAEDKTKLDGIEAGAKDDQNASEVPFTPTGSVAASDVQAAIAEVSGDADQALTDAATAQAAIDAHLDGGASKHDANEIDYERADGSKKDIQAASDEVEAALTDLDDNKISKTGSIAFTGDQSMGGFKLTNLAAPASPSDAARKADVDNAAAGVLSKESARTATTAALPAVTYDNGTGGVGATLTADANGALPTQDGVELTVGNRVLVKDQASAIQNGIYVVTALGDGSNPFVLTRSSDFDGSPTAEVQGGAAIFITEGTANINTMFRMTGTGEVTLGSGDINWIIYSRAEETSASGGIDKVGLDFRLASSVAGVGINLTGGVLSVDFTEFNTDDLSEGATNLFYTEGRFNTSFGTKDTDDLSEGTTNLYFTEARVRSTPITGFTSGAGALAATDTILQAVQKLDGNIEAHLANTTGAHAASAISYSGADLAGADVDAALDDAGSRIAALETATADTESLSEDFATGAGETLAAGIKAVRFAQDAETAGRLYLADNDASSVDNFHVIGLVVATGQTAGQDVNNVVKAGRMTATAHGFAIGKPIFLGAAGGLTNTAPSASGEAVVKVGIARDTNTIEVQIQTMGVN